MKKERKMALSLILPPIIFVGGVFIYLFVGFLKEETNLYYISETGVYLKIIKPSMDRCRYVIFSRDSLFSLSAMEDCIKIIPSEVSLINIILNPNNRNEVKIRDRFNDVVDISQTKFQIAKTNYKDTLLFVEDNVAGAHMYRLKCPYIDVILEGYLHSVYVASYDEEFITKIEPIQ